MRPENISLFKPRMLAFGPVAILLLAAAACGAAAKPATAPDVKSPAAKEAPAAKAPAAPVAAPKGTPAPSAAALPARPSPEVKVHPGKMTWMIGGWGAERFDYAFDAGGANNYIRFFGGFLSETNDAAEMLPGIASGWSVSQDGLTWTITIRDGVKFHDGINLTAEDVSWTWCHQWCPEALKWATQSGAQSQARVTDKIEQTGPNQVSLTTKRGDGSVPMTLLSAASPHPWVIMPKRAKLHDEALEGAYGKNPIGAGPMKLVKHIPAQVMSFERFDGYYYQPANGFSEDRRVKFTSLDLSLVPEEATRVAAIRAGEADIAPASLASRQQVQAGGGRLIFGREGIHLSVRVHGCWEQRYPCYDKRVRQALDYAMNKEEMRDRLFGGREVMEIKGWSAVTPSTIGYSPEMDPWPFNPNKARELLAAAGYKTPTDRNGKDFGKLKVNTWVSTSMPFLPESAQLAAESWRRELGIDAQVVVGDEAALKKASLAMELNGQVRWADSEARIDATSTMASSFGIPGNNGRLHEDPELFATVQKALAVIDPQQRPAVLNKLYLQLKDESYHFGIGYINIPWAVGPRVTQWQPFTLAFYPSAIHTITLK